MVKRSPSSSPEDLSNTDTKTPPKKPRSEPTNNPQKKSPTKSPKKSQAANNGTWTSEKKEKFMDEIIALGYKHADLESIAAKLELSKRQLVDQLVPNRGNLRGKAVKAVGGE